MIVYGGVVIDIDLGIGRHHGYRNPNPNHRPAEDHRIYLKTRHPAPCHPDRPHMAKGLCDRCYPRHWRTSR